jgi:hypothetical protein
MEPRIIEQPLVEAARLDLRLAERIRVLVLTVLRLLVFRGLVERIGGGIVVNDVDPVAARARQKRLRRDRPSVVRIRPATLMPGSWAMTVIVREFGRL